MKNFTLLFLFLCSSTAQAQITPYNNTARNTFYGIGGYSYSKQDFPDGVQANPYVVSGPSPQNDFSYAVSAVGGIKNIISVISTNNTNTPITIQFKNNNIRKFGCQVFGLNASTLDYSPNVINVTATTNLGANITLNAGNRIEQFVGFNVTGENEYLVSVSFQFQSTPNPAAFIGFFSVIVGDNTSQNVALNFDGIDDYVLIPSSVGNFATNQDFTVTCWIKPDPNQTSPNGQFYANENDIITKRYDNSASSSNAYPFEIRYLNNDRTVVSERNKIRVGQWDGTNFPFITSTTPLNDGKWHHVAFVRESGNFKLYIDGVQEGGTVADNATNATGSSTGLQIGSRANGQNFFKGEIDEVRIWNIGKTATQIADERFCKTPNTTNLEAFYNFSNGVPHGDNALITQINEAANRTTNGILNNFARTGDASNFVTGQVKYVRRSATAGLNNGSSWTNAFTNLQSALLASTCNDLFDVYVFRLTYRPDASNINIPFDIPSGMRMYGGFDGSEKSINQRNLALIHSTNKTTLSGDLLADDTPFVFTTNRTDNSKFLVNITGNNTVFDGFTVSGAGSNGAGLTILGTNATIKNSRGVNNEYGFNIDGGSAIIANCSIMGNKLDGIYIQNSTATNTTTTIKESLMANNGTFGLFINADNGVRQTTITNCTIAANATNGVRFLTNPSTTSINTIKNTVINGNGIGINIIGSGTATNTITYSLVQGDAGGTNGNLNGNTTNPQFVSPLASNVRSDTGNYRLKDSSPCINTGTDVGVSPFDLERNLRPKGGKTDMGAYESNINMNEIISVATGNWESNTTWNLDRVPMATDKVIVNGHQVTVTTNTARAKDLEYKTGAILRYLSGGLLRFGL